MDTGLDLWRIPQGWLVPRQCREELAGSVQGGQKATRPDSDVPVPKLWICRIVCKVSEDAFFVHISRAAETRRLPINPLRVLTSKKANGRRKLYDNALFTTGIRGAQCKHDEGRGLIGASRSLFLFRGSTITDEHLQAMG